MGLYHIMNNLTKSIDISDCVGDSLGKINYNFLSLDTTICNISSNFFDIPKNYYSLFSDLQNNIVNFNNFADVFENPIKFNLATTATKYLSAFWQKNEFTFTFPVNLIESGTTSKSFLDENYPDEVLIILGLNRMRKFYPSKNFQTNTIANVIFLIHSNSTGQDTVVLDKEVETLQNHIYDITARKNDVYIKKIKIAKFGIDPTTKSWTFLNFMIN